MSKDSIKRKWRSLVGGIAALVLIGCATTPPSPQVEVAPVVCPKPPKFEIEPPPELYHVHWSLLLIDDNSFYVLSPEEVEKLIINVHLLKEYCNRCYRTLKIIEEELDEASSEVLSTSESSSARSIGVGNSNPNR